MSDTPISDSTPHNVADLGILCRRLERELNAANERIKRLKEYIDNLQKLGDSMALGRNPFIQNAWTAAKEAKP
jgi:hypothetical protein